LCDLRPHERGGHGPLVAVALKKEVLWNLKEVHFKKTLQRESCIPKMFKVPRSVHR
jgi:hypothetical protein